MLFTCHLLLLREAKYIHTYPAGRDIKKDIASREQAGNKDIRGK
jgi:hypothetical protein